MFNTVHAVSSPPVNRKQNIVSPEKKRVLYHIFTLTVTVSSSWWKRKHHFISTLNSLSQKNEEVDVHFISSSSSLMMK